MVLNLASAALIVQNYNQNSTGVHITYTEYALSITELVFVSLGTLGLWKKYGLVNIFIPIFCIYIFNIVFSSFVIQKYDGNIIVDQGFYNVAIGIIVTNAMSLCGCFSIKIEKTDTDTDTDNTAHSHKPTLISSSKPSGGGGSFTITIV